MNNWNPIKTAPIQTPIIVFSPTEGRVIAERLSNGYFSALHSDYESGDPWLLGEGTPTHWTTLPDPPND